MPPALVETDNERRATLGRRRHAGQADESRIHGDYWDLIRNADASPDWKNSREFFGRCIVPRKSHTEPRSLSTGSGREPDGGGPVEPTASRCASRVAARPRRAEVRGPGYKSCFATPPRARPNERQRGAQPLRSDRYRSNVWVKVWNPLASSAPPLLFHVLAPLPRLTTSPGLPKTLSV